MIDTYVKEGKYSQGMKCDWTSWFQHEFLFPMQQIMVLQELLLYSYVLQYLAHRKHTKYFLNRLNK